MGSWLNCPVIFIVNCVFFQCSNLRPWSLKSPLNDTGNTRREMSVPAAQQHQLMCSDPFSGVRKQVVCSIHSVPGLPGCWTRLYLHKEFFADTRILVYSTGKRLLMQSQATIAELWKATPHRWDNGGSKPALFSGITLFELQSSDSAAMLGQMCKEMKAVKYSFHITVRSVCFWVNAHVTKRWKSGNNERER